MLFTLGGACPRPGGDEPLPYIAMKREYDFSKGERGRLYRPGAKLNMPIYLDEEVLGYLTERAQAKGVEVGELVNDLLKKDIALIEALK
jgi:hypothetical protein